MMGGRSYTPKRTAYQYTISTNSWTTMAYDSSLYTSTYNCGAAIIHMKGNGHRYLVISSNSGYSYPSYFDLTSNSGWKRLTYGPTGNHGRLVSVAPSEAYMVAGYTSSHSRSTRNWYLWNPQVIPHKPKLDWSSPAGLAYSNHKLSLFLPLDFQNEKFADHTLYMRRPHFAGDFSRCSEM